MQLDTTTALTIVAPEEVWAKIDGIRKEHDSAYGRWMPHINLLFPFVPLALFDDYHDKLQMALVNFGSIEIHFDKISHFSQKKAATVNLQVSDDKVLQELFKVITDTIPEVSSKKTSFKPHLTIGQFPKSQLDTKLKELTTWLGDGIKVTIDNIYMINRSTNDNTVPFSKNREISLK